MESLENMSLPAAPKGENSNIVLVPDLNNFNEIDYDSRNGLISDRLRALIESYIPGHNFETVVYLSSDRAEQAVFWKFNPPLYRDYRAAYRNEGIVSHISFSNDHAPITFTAKSPKGVGSIVVRMAVAESALRRGILGLKFTAVT